METLQSKIDLINDLKWTKARFEDTLKLAVTNETQYKSIMKNL